MFQKYSILSGTSALTPMPREKNYMSKILEEARPMAEAAALVVPAALLFAAV